MPTLMEFIVSQSSLPVGNAVRDHIENPGGNGTTIIMGEVDLDVSQANAEVNILDSVTVDAQNNDIVDIKINSAVSVAAISDKITVETCK